MAVGSKALLLVAALVAVRYLSQPAFVPPAVRKAAPLAIPAAAVLGASPAFADQISVASKKFAAASYPFLKSVPWDSTLYAKFPADPQKTLKAIDKVLIMASAMDGKALQTAVEAHHKAIATTDAKGVTSLADYTAIVHLQDRRWPCRLQSCRSILRVQGHHQSSSMNSRQLATARKAAEPLLALKKLARKGKYV